MKIPPPPPPEKAGNKTPSSVADKLNRKPYRPIPQSTRHGKTMQEGGVKGRNVEDAVWDHIIGQADTGAHAGGGNIDILGDKKGPPVLTKKVGEPGKRSPDVKRTPIPPIPKQKRGTGIKGPPGFTRSPIPPKPKQKGKGSGVLKVNSGLSTYGKQMP